MSNEQQARWEANIAAIDALMAGHFVEINRLQELRETCVAALCFNNGSGSFVSITVEEGDDE